MDYHGSGGNIAMSLADEWNTTRDPRRLLEMIGDKLARARVRQFLAGYWWLNRERLTKPELDIWEAVEEIALGLVGEKESEQVLRTLALLGIRNSLLEYAVIVPSDSAHSLWSLRSRCAMLDYTHLIATASRHAGPPPVDVYPHHTWHREFQDAYFAAIRPIADLLRCVFAPPLRAVSFDPRWRTETAIGLAGQMFDTREFSAMPILADALQDTGCENADVLNHCRNESPHVRGCWVVDAVLGR